MIYQKYWIYLMSFIYVIHLMCWNYLIDLIDLADFCWLIFFSTPIDSTSLGFNIPICANYTNSEHRNCSPRSNLGIENPAHRGPYLLRVQRQETSQQKITKETHLDASPRFCEKGAYSRCHRHEKQVQKVPTQGVIGTKNKLKRCLHKVSPARKQVQER